MSRHRKFLVDSSSCCACFKRTQYRDLELDSSPTAEFAGDHSCHCFAGSWQRNVRGVGRSEREGSEVHGRARGPRPAREDGNACAPKAEVRHVLELPGNRIGWTI